MKRTTLFMLIALLALGLLLVACDGGEESTPVAQQECPPCPACPEAEECPACPECPEAEACPECPECTACPECPEVPADAGLQCPHAEEWAASPHADAESEAFVHWDEDDPAEVPVGCAQCHSSTGFQDYVGADGSALFQVDAAAPIGTVVDCAACHNDAVAALDSVIFPSGVEVEIGDESAQCFICHQGRAWGGSITAAVEGAGLAEELDTPSEELGFVNIHYYAAAATLFGTITKGGYEYEGMTYDSHLSHVAAYDTCVECHDSHTLEVRAGECAACHSEGDFKDVRMAGSLVDYDGDGNVEEGIYYEIEGLQQALFGALQAYAAEVVEAPVVYDVHSHPYWFLDTNGNGTADEDEISRDNAYNQWTPRSLAAAYNYHTTIKDPGGYVHGGKYFVQLLHDSITSLNEVLAEPVDLSNARRDDPGHFAGSQEAWRHWDEDGMVEAGCATCHSAEGLPFFMEHGVQIEQPLSNGLTCESCHNDLAAFTTFETEAVAFPSGAEVTLEDQSNLCLTCHQGRSFGGTVDRATADLPADAPAQLRFINIHYFAAGATLFGSEVNGAYQYPDKAYAGRFAHVDSYNSCVECHNVHALTVNEADCTGCHPVEALADIRMGSTDYDGDGDTAEGIAGEVATMTEALYAAIQTYATGTEGVGAIEYNAARYPYFFNDAGEQFAAWTPTLLKAAYNYQYVLKDPGAFAHNPEYVIQFLYDSIESLGGDVSGMTRPEGAE
ncbi:MAG: hypothetical protein JXA93_03725 [Anaerolineae bacterium]|nr:hypothetical protein [Anaerolineae bacterium]